MSITQKYSQRAEYPFRKPKRSSTRLEKAKRVVLVRSKYAPAKAEKAAVEAANLVFPTEKKSRELEYYKGEKTVVPLSTETKPLLIHHHPDIERPLLSQETGRFGLLDNSRNRSLTALLIPTGQCVRSFLMVRLGRAILGISLLSLAPSWRLSFSLYRLIVPT